MTKRESIVAAEATATPFSVIVHAYAAAGWKPQAFMPGRPGLKHPGRWLGPKRGWCNLKGYNYTTGLASLDMTLDDVADWPTGALCMLGRFHPAIDVDCEDEAACRALRAVLAPTIERGRSSGSHRFLVPYRSPDAIKPWRPILFTLPGVEGQQAVELNGSGRQWLACGPHKNGGRYVWRDDVLGDLGPLQAPDAADLAVLTQADADRLRAALVEALRGLGATFRRGSDEPGRTGGTAGEDMDPDELEPTLTEELLAELLAAVPDNDETVGGWDEGVALLASMRACLGSEGPVVPDCVLDWAAGYPGKKYDGMAWAEARWESFRTVRSGKGPLLQWAEKHAPAELYDRLQAHADRVERQQACAAFPIEEGDMGEPPAGLGLRKTEDGEPDTQLELCRKAFVYREPTGEWIRVRDGAILKREVFNDVVEARAAAREAHQEALLANPKAKLIRAHELMQDHAARVQAVTYTPGRPKLYRDENGVETFNLYSAPPRPLHGQTIGAHQVKPLLDLVHWVFPDPADQVLFLDWMSFIAQNPGEKVQWAPVLFSKMHGVGKDLLLSVVRWGVVGRANFATIEPARLDGDFNADWAPTQVVYVTELPSYRKQDLNDRLKSLVADHAGDMSVNPKGQARYSIPNRHCWVFTTNKSDAIAMDVEDRRFAILHAREAKLDVALRDRVLAFYDLGGARQGMHLAGEWLRQRTISAAFSPNTCPAASGAKQAMIVETLGAQGGLLYDRLTEGDWRERRTILEGELASLIGDGARRGDLHKALQAAGFSEPDKADARGRITVGKGAIARKLKVWVRDLDGPAAGEPEALQAVAMRSRSGRAVLDVLSRELSEHDAKHATAVDELMREAGPKAV